MCETKTFYVNAYHTTIPQSGRSCQVRPKDQSTSLSSIIGLNNLFQPSINGNVMGDGWWVMDDGWWRVEEGGGIWRNCRKEEESWGVVVKCEVWMWCEEDHRNSEPTNNWQISSCNLWKTIIVSSTYGTCYSSDFWSSCAQQVCKVCNQKIYDLFVNTSAVGLLTTPRSTPIWLCDVNQPLFTTRA